MIILDATWKPVYAPGNTPITWYREIPTTYAQFNSKDATEHARAGVLPLPYTNEAVERYNARFRAQVFAVGELPKAVGE